MEKTIRLSLKTTRLIVSFAWVAFACQSTRAADGNNPLNLSTFYGWSAFELITQGDDISSISDPGYGNTAARGRYDGLGGYLSGNNLSIFINHEATNAAISRLDLDLEICAQRFPARSMADPPHLSKPGILRMSLC